MIRVLLDTHVFLWAINEPAKLSSAALAALNAPDSARVISIASIWEICIKSSQNRLTVTGGFSSIQDDLRANAIALMPIKFPHLEKNNLLHFRHKDPFDRMIAAQALVEKIDLVSVDGVFDKYFTGSEVKRIW